MEAAPNAASSLSGGKGTGWRTKAELAILKVVPERCLKLHVVPTILLLERPRRMEPWTAYRIKAAELFALANNEPYRGLRIQCDRMARAYLRLAEQAERNSHLDLTYETPPAKNVEAVPRRHS